MCIRDRNIAAAHRANRVDLKLGFGAFSGCRHAEAVGESNHRADDRDRFDAALGGADDEAAVDLDRRKLCFCLLYTSDAADERSSVDLGGRRIIKKKHSTILDLTRAMTYTAQDDT